MGAAFATVEDYLASLPDGARDRLVELMDAVRAEAPTAEEVIRYQIPTFQLGGKNLVHVAAWKRHLSMYPVPETDGPLAAELAAHQTGKGTLRFALDEPIPQSLVRRVVAELARQRFDVRH
jgi:uncharacterized protein YdhG (YjbR/CyaY superfamily)